MAAQLTAKMELDASSFYQAMQRAEKENKKLQRQLKNAKGELDNLKSGLNGAEFGKITKGAQQASNSLKTLGSGALASAGDLTQLWQAMKTGNGVKINANLNQISRSFGGMKTAIGGVIGSLGPYAIAGTLVTGMLTDWISKHKAAKEAAEKLRVDKITESLKEQIEPLQAASKEYNKQISHINALVAVAQDEHNTLQLRKQAIVELNSIVPNYNAQLDATTGKYYANADALKAYLNKLVAYKRAIKYVDAAAEQYDKADAERDRSSAKNGEQDYLRNEQAKLKQLQAEKAELYKKMETSTNSHNEKYYRGQIVQTNLKIQAQEKAVAEAQRRVDNRVKNANKYAAAGDALITKAANQYAAAGDLADPSKPTKQPKTTTPRTTTPPVKSFKTQVLKTELVSLKDYYDKLNEDLKTKPLAPIKIDLEGVQAFQDELEKTIEKLRAMREAGYALQDIGGSINALGGAISSFGGDTANAIGTMVNAIGNIFQVIGQVVAAGGAQALAQALTLPWPANAAAIATTIGLIGTVTSTVASLSKMKFANGGVVGGASLYGDNITANVNAGEMILNRTQQARLFDLIASPGASQNTQQQVEFKLRGTELIGVINNTQRKRSRV